jgi:hypothetical protein
MSGDAHEQRVDEAAGAMDDTARELEEHNEQLSGDIEEARRAARHAREVQQVAGFSGDPEDLDLNDRTGGNTAEAFDETGERRRDDEASRG